MTLALTPLRDLTDLDIIDIKLFDSVALYTYVLTHMSRKCKLNYVLIC